jgi:hypothetical protein
MNRDEFEDRMESLFEHPGDPRERARMEAMVAADPALRARWDDLQPVLEPLAAARLEPLPAGLHATLIETARASETRGRAQREGESWFSFIRAAIQARPAFALGGAVAAGIAIGAIGIGLLFGPLRGPGGLLESGVHTGQDLAPSTSASLPPIADASAITALDLDDTHVKLTALHGGPEGRVIVRLEARGEAPPAVVTLAWDPAALRLSGAHWQASDAPAFESGPGRVQLPVPASAGSELIFSPLVPGGITVRATLSAGGSEKQETLRLPR